MGVWCHRCSCTNQQLCPVSVRLGRNSVKQPVSAHTWGCSSPTQLLAANAHPLVSETQSTSATTRLIRPVEPEAVQIYETIYVPGILTHALRSLLRSFPMQLGLLLMAVTWQYETVNSTLARYLPSQHSLLQSRLLFSSACFVLPN